MSTVSVVTISGADTDADAAIAAEAIAAAEVVVMRASSEPGDLRSYYNRLVETIGEPIDAAEDFRSGGKPTGERWAEICFDPDIPDDLAFRYSRNAQPLHTDESYISTPAGVMLFYCVSAAPSGGETIFVSGAALVEELRAKHPAFLDELLSTDVCYQKAGDSRTRPIIKILDSGGVDLNFNYYCIDPNQPPQALDLNERFFGYLQNEMPRELVLAVDLKPGDSLTWRDQQVLHGRNSFQAELLGDRLIWKTGIVLDE